MTTAAASLESGEFAAAENLRLQELAREIAALGYDEAARQRYYAETRHLQSFEGQQLQLSQAREHLPEEEESLAQAQEMMLRRRQELAGQEERLEGIEAALIELPKLETQQIEAQRAVSELENSRETAFSRQGYLEGQVRRLAELREAVGAISSRMQSSQEEQGIYQELVTAFGKQGVQAMLIETVVPRLEEEANALLGRMTDNRMHLKLETQRERRTGRGEPIETLEINVSDELGPRSYEMYSGGEAFRVNLALRIALSKVLAQRRGAPLPTLFIDEGFGTQDAAGRERILDVISAIQDDFDKIIVITHLDDLKDMFPVRIEVQKGRNGSTFWLS
jgi:exonuclease SbcC